jgi:hypothetical protein
MLNVPREFEMKLCKARLQGVLGVGCDLGWGHEGQHRHIATNCAWPAYTQRCGHEWCSSICVIEAEKKTELLERARGIARSALRPATLAAEFGVTTERIVDAIAHALSPFIERSEDEAVARRAAECGFGASVQPPEWVTAWRKAPPTVNEVARRQKVEGQSPRYWSRALKLDGHGNERFVVEMRVMDGALHWLIDGRWQRFDDNDEYEWAPCSPPAENK